MPNCTVDLWGTFSSPRPRFSFYAGTKNIGGLPSLHFETYNVRGDRVFGGSASVGNGIHTLVTVDPDSVCGADPRCVSDPGRDIAYFRVFFRGLTAETGTLWGIDDFTFDSPVSPPVANFGLTLASGVPVVVTAGRSTTAKIAIGRHNGSTGPISFSHSNAPPGVDVGLPGPHDSADDETIEVTLTGRADLKPGTRGEIIVTGSPSGPATGAGSRSVAIPVVLTISPSQQKTFDLQAQGLLVTQAVQLERARSMRQYAGVPLVAGKQTIVRFYATVEGALKRDNVQALLYGSRDGRALPGSPLPAYAPKTIQAGSSGDPPDTADNEPSIFSFELPPEWVEAGTITLRARVVTPEVGLLNFPFVTSELVPCVSATCQNNDWFVQSGIRFDPTLPYYIAPVPLHYTRWDKDYGSGATTLTLHRPAPTDVAFRALTTLSPIARGNLIWNPDALVMDISDIVNVDQLFPTQFEKVEDEQKAERARAVQLVTNCAAKLVSLGEADVPCPDLSIALYPADELADGGDYKNDRVLALMDAWEAANRAQGNPARAVNMVLGLNDGPARGVMHLPSDGVVLLREQGPNFKVTTKKAVGVGSTSRPILGVAHEVFHAYGHGHAGTDCPGARPGEDQQGEPWPPDEKGFAWVDEVGHDLTTFGSADRPYEVVDLGEPRVGRRVPYDLMSYCTTEQTSWLSERNWRRAWAFHVPVSVEEAATGRSAARVAARRSAALSRLSASSGPTTVQSGSEGRAAVRVAALLSPRGEGVITDVMRVDTSAPELDSTDFSLVALDASGATIARAPMGANRRGDSSTLSLVGYLPVNLRPQRLQIVRNDKPIGPPMTRSAHAPSLRIVRPRPGQTLGARSKTTIAWRATDGDGDPLEARVDYSLDGGRTWRVVYIGPSKNRVRLPSRLLGAARRARIRVAVSDGFNETIAISKAFRSLGRGPTPRILLPRRSAQVRADQPLGLRGLAFDDRSRRIRNSRLRWYLGRRLIARGRQAQIVGLPPGRRRLRLMATDRRGRVGRSGLTLSVRAVRPTVLSFRAPDRVPAKTRRMKMRLAVSVPAKLTVSGRGIGRARFTVGRRPRTIVVRIRRSRQRLLLRLTINAHGRKTHRAYIVSR